MQQIQYGAYESDKTTVEEVLKNGTDCTYCSRKATRIISIYTKYMDRNFQHGYYSLETRCGLHTNRSSMDSRVEAKLVNGNWEIVKN